MDADDNIKVLIENGSPRTHTLSTLAHELTHVWQFDNLKFHEYKLEEMEGFASWVEIDLLTKIGETRYANKLKENLLQRQDEYGIGYRLIIEKLAELPEGATPFELFHGVLTEV
jgi:hypothetical protein